MEKLKKFLDDLRTSKIFASEQVERQMKERGMNRIIKQLKWALKEASERLEATEGDTGRGFFERRAKEGTNGQKRGGNEGEARDEREEKA